MLLTLIASNEDFSISITEYDDKINIQFKGPLEIKTKLSNTDPMCNQL